MIIKINRTHTELGVLSSDFSRVPPNEMEEADDIWCPVLTPGFCRRCGMQMGTGCCALAFFKLIMGI